MGESKPTVFFVIGFLLFIAWGFVSSVGIPTERLIFYSILLAWEIWALVNKRKRDTISEVFWFLCAYPLVPWGCGALYSHYVTNGTISNVVEVLALAGLQMHFFWQSASVYREYQKVEAE